MIKLNVKNISNAFILFSVAIVIASVLFEPLTGGLIGQLFENEVLCNTLPNSSADDNIAVFSGVLFILPMFIRVWRKRRVVSFFEIAIYYLITILILGMLADNGCGSVGLTLGSGNLVLLSLLSFSGLQQLSFMCLLYFKIVSKK